MRQALNALKRRILAASWIKCDTKAESTIENPSQKEEAPKIGRRAVGSAVLGAGIFASAAAKAGNIPPNLAYTNATNIHNFGVKGDGTDETAKLQAAINAAASSGAYLLFFPPGSYGISGQLSIPNGVSLIGVGAQNDVANGVAVTRILALSGFPTSTPMLSFSDQWCGRFENFVIDGGAHATCGIHESSTRSCIFRNILIKNIGNALASDYCWRIDATTITSALNYYEHVTISPYGVAAGTQGFVMSGTYSNGSELYAVTEHTFINCEIGGGNGAAAFVFAQCCDNNWFYGCNITVIGNAPGGVIVLNINNDLSYAVGEMYFIGCSIYVSGSTGYGIVCKYNSGPNTFVACYLNPEPQAYFTDTQGWINIATSTFGDILAPGIKSVSLGSSPYTYVNPYPYKVQFMFWGGSLSAVSFVRNGASNGLGGTTNGSLVNIILEPRDGITLTYSSPPTAVAYPMS